ncbi:restriction endonuclease subunit S, partial [Jatrophihabitans lederbergiae]|uniref:restriction endonuclease subunit S n=1 Tax=Jatrophihabitans lederbergiae TaxID=3075547 RepID=UPI0037C094CB
MFSTVRPYLEKIAYVDESLADEFASTGFSVLRPGPRLHPRFLFYFATSRDMLDQVLPFQKGVSYPAVLDKEVRRVVMPVPPIDEQRRIVDTLEDHLSRLDAANAGLDMASRRATMLTTAAAMHAITGTGSSNSERLLSFGDLDVTVPRDWIASTVGDEASLVQYGTSAKTSEAQGPNPIAVLRMGNLQRGSIVTDKLKFLARDHPDVAPLLLQRGDLLFNRTNSAELARNFHAAPVDRRSWGGSLCGFRLCRAGRTVWPRSLGAPVPR